MPRKPDRFERVVEKLSWLTGHPDDGMPDFVVHTSTVIKLLREEHTWMVRMVKNTHGGYGGTHDDSLELLRKAIRSQLQQRRK